MGFFNFQKPPAMHTSILKPWTAFICLTLSIHIHGQVPSQKVGEIKIQPLMHASMHLSWKEQSILIDPYKNENYYKNISSPELILITDIHGDHLNIESLKNINIEKTQFVVPQAVANILRENGFTKIQELSNGSRTNINGMEIAAIPMYNLPQEEKSKHPKGRGNGYIITLGNQKVYLSGDTEDIAEMRQLQNIDIAFVCMNLPYTMDVEAAASAVLDFKPKLVFPYHYRGGGGKFSDIHKFKELVNASNEEIEVRLVDWYQQ